MYGVIGKMRAVAGRRDDLAAILLEGVSQMPGCLSYVVSMDASDADVIWVTEVWTDEAAHRASLQVPEVRDAIQRGLPLIKTFSDATVTTPVGGVGMLEP